MLATRYGMYSREGDAAVHAIVRNVVACLPDYFPAASAAEEWIRLGMLRVQSELGSLHPEVFDTVVREALYDALDRAVAEVWW